ncbi:MAG: tRNA (guanosine(46)-N7)-methyltransferase TrmB [Hymenobacteraceae bacterium]|nr:tRNA (guanosine(46)-N7)-methyltransferase TrmB [Hymenobacteraceae bacterium]
MSRVKLKRFAENQTRADVVEPGKPIYKTLGGDWNARFFQTDASRPLTLEVGCGKGDYTVGLAERFPTGNFLGLDIKGERLWTGSTRARELGLTNVGWLRGQAQELAEHFSRAELAGIWLTFPDPHDPLGAARPRLTAPRFLELYRHILRPGGLVRLKTDSVELFEYTLSESLPTQRVTDIRFTRDLYGPDGAGLLADAHGIQTHFERRYRAIGKPITYLEFAFAP